MIYLAVELLLQRINIKSYSESIFIFPIEKLIIKLYSRAETRNLQHFEKTRGNLQPFCILGCLMHRLFSSSLSTQSWGRHFSRRQKRAQIKSIVFQILFEAIGFVPPKTRNEEMFQKLYSHWERMRPESKMKESF